MAGAGATEIELAKEIASYGEKCPGLAQYAIQKFAESLEQLPRAIAVNAGVKVQMLHDVADVLVMSNSYFLNVELNGDYCALFVHCKVVAGTSVSPWIFLL